VAARLKPRHQEEIRAKIQVAQLVKFLEEHALSGKGTKNTASRIMAARILLNKSLPDLHASVNPNDLTQPPESKLDVKVSFV
jgi:hypothetical protein